MHIYFEFYVKVEKKNKKQVLERKPQNISQLFQQKKYKLVL